VIGFLLCCAPIGTRTAASAANQTIPDEPFDPRRNDPRCRDRVGSPIDDVPELPKAETPPVIPNTRTAIRIAEAYFQSRLPEARDPEVCRLEARLTNGVWHVGGVLPPDYLGGCLHIEMCQLNGRVLRAWGEQ
jgi:hypothetical protein